MKRFKVGDLAKLIHARKDPRLQNYVGTICEIKSSPGICTCSVCAFNFVIFGDKPTNADYSVRFVDGAVTVVDDPQLAPIGDPDAALDEFKHREEDERETI